MKTIIIDDEPKAIKILAARLKRNKAFTIEGIAGTGEEGLKLIEEVKPVVVFLDVELPDIDGIEAIEKIMTLTDNRCKVVMYSAYDKYMLPSFRNLAFDFLLKPLNYEELDIVIKRLEEEVVIMDDCLDETLIRKNQDDKLLLHTNVLDFKVVRIKNICLFQYSHESRLWEVVVSGYPVPLVLKRNANNITIQSIDPCFTQVSQKHIINIGYLMEVTNNTCRFYPPFDKVEDVKVGRLFRKKLIDQFCNL